MQLNTDNENHKKWTKYLAELIPGEVNVSSYFDESNTNSIAIFTSSSDEGIFAATVGLMEFDQSKNPESKIFSEIVMDSRGKNEIIGNVIAMLGFYVGKDRWHIAPGVIFEKMVEMYNPDLAVKHVLFTPVFQSTGLSEVQLDTLKIYPLLAVPITDEESKIVATKGYEYLLENWENQKKDVLDWNRQS